MPQVSTKSVFFPKSNKNTIKKKKNNNIKTKSVKLLFKCLHTGFFGF